METEALHRKHEKADRLKQEGRQALLHDLKKKIAELEEKNTATFEPLPKATDTLPENHFRFGVASLDRAFTKGAMPLHALHEVHSTSNMAGTATGFLLMLLASLSKANTQKSVNAPIIWITNRMSKHEVGTLYGPGLEEIGLNPAMLLLIEAPKDKNAFWAAEEALAIPEALGVVLDLNNPGAAFTLKATRRLHLRAEKTGLPAFILLSGHKDDAPESTALTRWQITPAPSAPTDLGQGLGPPAMIANLTRNRRGKTGRFYLQWNKDDVQFSTFIPARQQKTVEPAHSGTLVPLSFDRQAGAA